MSAMPVEDLALDLLTDRPWITLVWNDPINLMTYVTYVFQAYFGYDKPKAELIWASPRELLNIFQADDIGCQVITVTNDILKKLTLVGYGLDQYSLDTVKMFYNDALAAGFNL
jgi:transaldolase